MNRSLTPVNLQTQRVQLDQIRSATPNARRTFGNENNCDTQDYTTARDDTNLKAAKANDSVSQAKIDAQIGPYEVGRIIGSGMIGVALVARHIRSKRVFCLKCMHRAKIIEKNLGLNIKQEVEFMIELNDQDYIMPLEQLITRERELIMVFPYFPGRDLYRFMKIHKSPKGFLTEHEAWVITK